MCSLWEIKNFQQDSAQKHTIKKFNVELRDAFNNQIFTKNIKYHIHYISNLRNVLQHMFHKRHQTACYTHITSTYDVKQSKEL